MFEVRKWPTGVDIYKSKLTTLMGGVSGLSLKISC